MKITECTPQQLRCGIGACPSVFKLGDGTLVIIGRPLISKEAEQLGLATKIGSTEAAVAIHADYLKEINP